LAVLVFRRSAALNVLLPLHLAVVASFFVLLPASKFVHGTYHAVALLRAAMERSAAGRGAARQTRAPEPGRR
jgi:citrate/tricarballylate utilization protein